MPGVCVCCVYDDVPGVLTCCFIFASVCGFAESSVVLCGIAVCAVVCFGVCVCVWAFGCWVAIGFKLFPCLLELCGNALLVCVAVVVGLALCVPLCMCALFCVVL